MLTEAQAWQALDAVEDPEIPVISVTELGIVREVILGEDGLRVVVTPTYSGCPATEMIAESMVDALKAELLAHPVLHADETPVAMLEPGAGKTHRAYLWSYSVGAFDPLKAVIYDFTDSRAGRHAQAFLGQWRGTLVCDDYAGYKAQIGRAHV